ncbi:MAG: chitobiase/beta-hexosaminidase C-terminal domain-containing protein, partial [Planctomycetota bacterium]
MVLSDALSVLNALFQGGPLLDPPFSRCGTDPTADDLTCASFPPCEGFESSLVLTEFLANNETGLRDGYQEYSDWIEITNTGTVTVEAAGYFLTDDLDELTKWEFPLNSDETQIAAGASLLVFASGADGEDPAGNLHTNFQLDADGESFALVAPDGVTIVSRFGPGVPTQRSDVSYGLSAVSDVTRFPLADGDDVRYHVGDPGAGWADPSFDDSAWPEGRTGLVYETEERGLYRGKFRTNLETETRNISASVYLRAEFEVDANALEELVLHLRYDDGFVAFLNGVEVARDNVPVETPRPDEDSMGDFASFDLSDRIDLLEDGHNVLAIQLLNESADAARFLVVPVIETLERGQYPVYFTDPTPRAANGTGLAAIVRDTEFNVDRGFYDAAFDVAITSGTPGATIRYTLDGSAPSVNSGLLYSAPIRVTTTTTLRAAAFRNGLLETNVDTQSYLFLADVLRQVPRPPGYPTTWAGIPADYEMDPEIVDHPAYRDEIENDLRSIPSFSIVMNRNEMFGSQGIYTNGNGRGLAWERVASVELLSADGSEKFQEDAGIRLHGGAGRNAEHPKKSFRLIFRGRYGAKKLRYPLFANDYYGEGAVESFDKLILRAGFNNTLPHWYDEQALRAQYVRDQWARDLQFEMGQVAVRGRYVHLYINGIYWGLYNLTERPDEDWAASYRGGTEDDFDIVKNGELKAGTRTLWN